jgi:hypothetical protein
MSLAALMAGGADSSVARAREGKGRGGYYTCVEAVPPHRLAYRDSSMGAERQRRAVELTTNGQWRFAHWRVRTGCVAPV